MEWDWTGLGLHLLSWGLFSGLVPWGHILNSWVNLVPFEAGGSFTAWGGVKVKHFCATSEQLHVVGRRPHTCSCFSLLASCGVQTASQQSFAWLFFPWFVE